MALLARWAEATPDKVAAHFPDIGRSLTFRELDARATRIAQWLVSLGLQPGEGIAMLMDNRPNSSSSPSPASVRACTTRRCQCTCGRTRSPTCSATRRRRR